MILEAVAVKKYFPVTGGFGVGGVRGWIKAVDGVSVGVAEGETLGIVGESGSGKTTLAKLFLLLERPTGGELRFDGADLSGFGRGELARYLSTKLAVMYSGRLVETGACDDVYGDPLHPYTQALLSAALPLHPSARRERIVLSGEIPNPMNPPTGCRFHPRCPKAMPHCRTEEPAWREVKPTHFTACHLY